MTFSISSMGSISDGASFSVTYGLRENFGTEEASRRAAPERLVAAELLACATMLLVGTARRRLNGERKTLRHATPGCRHRGHAGVGGSLTRERAMVADGASFSCLQELIYKHIYAYNQPMRRKPGHLLPLELAICTLARDRRKEFHGFEIAKLLSRRDLTNTAPSIARSDSWRTWAAHQPRGGSRRSRG